MEENKNIKTEQPAENIPEEIISSDETAMPDLEAATAEQPQTINYQPQTEDMEVHHHAHDPAAPHPKKNWKSYFWEFLMLFLAVFCGFLAEYQLEHKIERDRAKELAKSFYQELKNDSVTANVKVQNRIKQEGALKNLIPYFKDSSLTNVSKQFSLNFLYGVSFRTPSIFEPRTVMLEQLRNSGSLRYFKNEELQTLTGDLTVAIKNIYDRQDIENKTRNDYITPFQINHLDFEFSDKITANNKSIFEGLAKYENSNENIPYHINEPNKIDRNNITRILAHFASNLLASTRTTHIAKYQEINAKLLKLLRDEYHLE